MNNNYRNQKMECYFLLQFESMNEPFFILLLGECPCVATGKNHQSLEVSSICHQVNIKISRHCSSTSLYINHISGHSALSWGKWGCLLKVVESKHVTKCCYHITSFVHGRVDNGNLILIEKNCNKSQSIGCRLRDIIRNHDQKRILKHPSTEIIRRHLLINRFPFFSLCILILWTWYKGLARTQHSWKANKKKRG